MSGKSEEKISKIIDTIKSEKIEWIRLQFCDPFGILQQISVDENEITKE